MIETHGLHACRIANRYIRGSVLTESEEYELSFFTLKEVSQMSEAFHKEVLNPIHSKSTNE